MEGNKVAQVGTKPKSNKKKTLRKSSKKKTNPYPKWKMNLIYESELSRTNRLLRKKLYNEKVRSMKSTPNKSSRSGFVVEVLPNDSVHKKTFVKDGEHLQQLDVSDELLMEDLPHDPLDTDLMTPTVTVDVEN